MRCTKEGPGSSGLPYFLALMELMGVVIPRTVGDAKGAEKANLKLWPYSKLKNVSWSRTVIDD